MPSVPVIVKRGKHRLNIELDLQSLFGLYLIDWGTATPPLPQHLGLYSTRALLVSQDRRHIFVVINLVVIHDRKSHAWAPLRWISSFNFMFFCWPRHCLTNRVLILEMYFCIQYVGIHLIQNKLKEKSCEISTAWKRYCRPGFLLRKSLLTGSVTTYENNVYCFNKHVQWKRGNFFTKTSLRSCLHKIVLE